MLNRDKIIGAGLVIASVIAIVLIAYLLFFAGEAIAILTLKAIVMIAVLALAGIVGWIGYTLASTPPPKPIEEI
ncbi:MAG: transcriptional regulator, partial [Ignisphaera sp.]|nr:transcriptional regulator [Ignisphaera sp.]